MDGGEWKYGAQRIGVDVGGRGLVGNPAETVVVRLDGTREGTIPNLQVTRSVATSPDGRWLALTVTESGETNAAMSRRLRFDLRLIH